MLKSLLLLACLAIVDVAHAQHAAKVYRIGVIHAGGAYQRMVDGLRAGLKESGLQERSNFILHEREVRDLKAVEPAARRLVDEGVHVLFTMPSSVTLRAKNATSDIPIVFYAGTDPVRTGLIQSFAKPGGRLTGLYHPATDLGAKRLEFAKQLLPHARRVLVLYDSQNPQATNTVQLARHAAQKLGLELVERPVRSVDEAIAAVEALPPGSADVLFQISDPLVVSATARAGELLKQRRLPMFALDLTTVDSVALAGYGVNFYDVGRRASKYVRHVMSGGAASDMPVQIHDEVQLVVNLRIAKELGIAVPQPVLMRAHQVIQ